MLVSVRSVQVAASVRWRFGLQWCNASEECGVEKYRLHVHCNYIVPAVEC